MILYTLYENSYIDIAHLETLKDVHVYVNLRIVAHVPARFV